MPIPIEGGGVPELYDVIYRIHRAANAVASIAVRIQSIPLLGIALSIPFSALAGNIGAIADALGLFLIRYERMVNAIAGGDYSLAIEAALDIVFPDWRRIVQDPLGYILDKLFFLFPHASTLFRDPARWLSDLLAGEAGPLADLLKDPIAIVQEALNQLFAGLSDFLRDPVGWLKRTLAQLLGTDVSFWDDPIGNLWALFLKWIEDNLQAFSDWVYGVGEKVLFYLWFRGE